MKYLVKYSPEMTIKSRPVRNRFIKQLGKNLRRLLGRLSGDISVQWTWDYIAVDLAPAALSCQTQVENVLGCTPGICFFERVRQYPLGDMDQVLDHALAVFGERLAGKTFAVRCKRTGKHAFNSMDVERHVGGGLNMRCNTAGVDLTHPQVPVKLEIRDQDLYLVEATLPGLGGFPLGSQDGVLSLISGGFDSAVASYMANRRGLLTHFCFFNLGGREHEIAVKEVALFLWMRYGASHPVKFVTVPFEAVVGEILEKVDNAQMGVVLKRMMLRAAGRVAEILHLQALVTGEAVAQVSSQTLPNLAVIDQVTDTLVFRPLAMMEKQQIVDIAREIGTEAFSAVIPEYCGVISVKPTTRAKLHRIEREESRFDFTVLDAAIDSMVIESIERIAPDAGSEQAPLAIVATPEAGQVVIDIRHQDDEEKHPLQIEGCVVEKIPFYKLNTVLSARDKNTPYLLYCDKGIMSKLHAAFLQEEGFEFIGVYRPENH